MDVFYALAEPRRRKIMELLAGKGELTATEISSKFDVTAQAISQHLGILLDAKLVLMNRQAQRRIYRINTAAISEIDEWIKRIERQWDGRLDRLDTVLKAEKNKNAKKLR